MFVLVFGVLQGKAILARLMEGQASVSELTTPFDMSQPAISKHLKVLERAGLISRGRDAQRRPCRIVARPLAEANDWLERYRAIWEANFARLDAVLEELLQVVGGNGQELPLQQGRTELAKRPRLRGSPSAPQ